MPIFEYRCRDCGHDFQKLLFSQRSTVSCPACGSSTAEKRPSVFGMSGVEKQVHGRSSCSGCHSGSCSSCHSA